jgi:glycosyltransferase involved in cell wall biosynthesis
MKICLVTNLYEPYSTGGADIYVKWLAQALMQHGHHPFVVTTCPAGESFPGFAKEVIHGIPVYRFYPLNLYWGYQAQRKPLFLKPFWHSIELWNPHVYSVFRNILSKESPEIVHINNMGGFSNAIFWAAKNKRCRLIYTLHDYLSVCPKSILLRKNFEVCSEPHLLCKFYQMTKRWNLRKTVDMVISPSQFLIEMHRRHGLLNKNQYAVIPQGVEITSEDIKQVNKARGNYHSNGSINILYVGRVEEYKGLAVLARAFKSANRDNLCLNIGGSGDFMRNLQAEFKDCDNLKFYGWVSGAEKEKLFLNSDVFVLPSTWYDNAPLVIFEAYKYGLPVIGSRIGGIPEMIKPDETGFLFEPGDDNGLAVLLQSLSKDQLRKMVSACLQAAMDHSMEKHLERLMDLYQRLGGSGR